MYLIIYSRWERFWEFSRYSLFERKASNDHRGVLPQSPKSIIYARDQIHTLNPLIARVFGENLIGHKDSPSCNTILMLTTKTSFIINNIYAINYVSKRFYSRKVDYSTFNYNHTFRHHTCVVPLFPINSIFKRFMLLSRHAARANVIIPANLERFSMYVNNLTDRSVILYKGTMLCRPVITNMVIRSNPWHYTPPSLSNAAFLKDDNLTSKIESIKNLFKTKQSDDPSYTIEKVKTEFQTLITKSKEPGYNFESQINSETLIENISTAQLLFEALKRNLIKLDDGKTTSELIAEDGHKIVTGTYPYSVKMTPTGLALQKSVKSTIPSNGEKVLPQTNKEFMLIAVTKTNSDIIILSGTQTHINVVVKNTKVVCVFDENTQSFKAIGFLTSQNIGKKISDQQFKVFQNMKEAEENNKQYNPSSQQKIQNFVSYNTIKEIPKECATVLKWNEEYINLCLNKTILIDAYDISLENPTESYYKGISINELLLICKLYDYNKQNKIAQPKTDLQLAKEKEGQLKQKEKQIQAKMNKTYSKSNKTKEENEEKHI